MPQRPPLLIRLHGMSRGGAGGGGAGDGGGGRNGGRAQTSRISEKAGCMLLQYAGALPHQPYCEQQS